MKRLLYILLHLYALQIFSQSTDIQNPKFTIRGNFGIPRSAGSMMFRQSFSGIFEGNLSFNYRMFDNMFVGVGYQNSFFKVHKSFVYYKANNGNLSYNTQLLMHGAFLKIGYDKYATPDLFMNYSLNSGMAFCKYTSVIPDTSRANQPYGLTEFSAPYVQPEVSVNFLVGEDERNMCLSVMFAYTTLFYKFDPKAPRFNHMENVYIKGNRYFMNWFTIGVGFTAFIGGKPVAGGSK